jgi:hypothetical protein
MESKKPLQVFSPMQKSIVSKPALFGKIGEISKDSCVSQQRRMEKTIASYKYLRKSPCQQNQHFLRESSKKGLCLGSVAPLLHFLLLFGNTFE